MTTQDQNLLLAINLGFIFGFYFMPGIIAGACVVTAKLGANLGCEHLLLGWTIIGWIAALVWAIPTSSRRRESQMTQAFEVGLRTLSIDVGRAPSLLKSLTPSTPSSVNGATARRSASAGVSPSSSW